MICSKCGANIEKDDMYCKKCGVKVNNSIHKEMNSINKEYWYIPYLLFIACSIIFVVMIEITESDHIMILLLSFVILTFLGLLISLFLEVFKNKKYYFLIPLIISLCGLVTGIIGIILLEEFEDTGYIYISITAILLYVVFPISLHILKKRKGQSKLQNL